MNLWIAFTLLFLSACTKSHCPENPFYKQNSKIKILSSVSMIDDLVSAVGGEHIDREILIPNQIDPHSYELVKGDDEKFSCANIIFACGLNFEHSASFKSRSSSHPCAIFLGEEIQRQSPERIILINGEVDPHIWMDVSIWSCAVKPIVEVLSKLDPQHKKEFEENGRFLFRKLSELHESIYADLQEVSDDMRYIVSSHDAFRYFTKAYLSPDGKSLDRCISPEGLSPNNQLSIRDISRVVDYLIENSIDVVFSESNVNLDSLKKVVSSCPHKVRICRNPLYSDAVGSSGSNADSYMKMIKHNAKVLKEAWQAPSELTH